MTILSMALLLGGCASGIVDHTDDKQYQPLRAACFTIKKPAFLYEARCADLQAGRFGDSSFCTGIQGFAPKAYQQGIHTYHYQYPSSWREYLSSRHSWDKKMFPKLLFEKQRSMIAPVGVGTQLRITGIYEYPRGEMGHVPIVRAKLISGQFKNTEVELPSQHGFSDAGPDWISSWFQHSAPDTRLSSEYLQPCND
ncbi:hypothetical protein [Celerinatantimonas sp. YJH-8]|uniref:hypothetical protein n=1 Tax=Celerinatantimonas sp. YJH-8 TaxID=3228714 RepID=UPI0038CB580E